MMKKICVGFLLLFSLLLMVGCTKSASIDFKAETHKDIKKIIILMPPTKETTKLYYYRYSLKDSFLSSKFGIITGPFGLFYTLKKMEEFKDRNNLYNKLTVSLKFNADKYFANKLALYLRQEGYSIEISPKNTTKLMEEYLDRKVYFEFVVSGIGYHAENAATTLKPNAWVYAKLIKNQKSIYEKYILAGVITGHLLVDEIDDLGYREEECYKDFDMLIANTNQSVERLKKGLDRIAKHIAVTLRR